MRLLEKLKSYKKEFDEYEEDLPEEDTEAAEEHPPVPEKPRNRRQKPQAERRAPEHIPPIDRIEMFRPSTYEDCQHISDALKDGAAVIVDYYYTLESTARHIQQFMSGFIYASEGYEEKLSAYIFVYTPRHAGIISGPKNVNMDKTLRFPWGR